MVDIRDLAQGDRARIVSDAGEFEVVVEEEIGDGIRGVVHLEETDEIAYINPAPTDRHDDELRTPRGNVAGAIQSVELLE